MTNTIRIGCGAGFWGDTSEGAAQLVHRGNIDVLVLDYLAEITMSILARMRQKRPESGYATDFVDNVMAPLAVAISEKKIKVVANAGGVNPEGCRDALEKALAKVGVSLRIAVVLGDDIMGDLPALREAGTVDTESGKALPEKPLSANAYLGAHPIAEALRRGADVVITGRCVDSALTLGPLLAKFGWKNDDWDLLAAGSLAGHVIECGAQATGGLFTDWRKVERGYADMGFPVIECAADGTFVIEKPEGTGGLIIPASIAEQIVYEVGDPTRYLLPDVTCDFSRVHLEAAGENKVKVSGARGLSAPPAYKASITYGDGYRCATTLMILGNEARAKAERVGQAILERAARLNAARGLGPFRETSVEVIGGEGYFGESSRTRATREVVLKIAASHGEMAALETFAREIAPSATAMVSSITGFAGGRPSPSPIVRLASCLVDRHRIRARVVFEGATIDVSPSDTPSAPLVPAAPESHPVTIHSGEGDDRLVPLLWLAHGRSGDKGNIGNIGILARRREYVPLLRAAVTEEAVASYLQHLVKGPVRRYEWPGLGGFNFVCQDALGGGGIASLRHDPQGKGLSQILLELPIRVPRSLTVEAP